MLIGSSGFERNKQDPYNFLGNFKTHGTTEHIILPLTDMR